MEENIEIKRPITLEEYVQENCPEKREMVKVAIRYYEDFKSSILNYKIGSTEQKYCGICLSALTSEEEKKITPFDLNITCTNHKKYSFWFDRRRAREDSGLERNIPINFSISNSNPNVATPKSTLDFIKITYPNEVEFFNKIFEIYFSFEKYRLEDVCDVCQEELSDNEKKRITPTSVMRTCGEHEKYRNYFQHNVARKEAGYDEDGKLPINFIYFD